MNAVLTVNTGQRQTNNSVLSPHSVLPQFPQLPNTMKHPRARFSSGRSWKDPETVGLNVAIMMCYVVGLIGFQKATGMLDLRLSEYMNQPKTAAFSSEQGKEWLEKFEAVGDPTRVLFRHLLQSPADGNTTDGEQEEESDPLFPPPPTPPDII